MQVPMITTGMSITTWSVTDLARACHSVPLSGHLSTESRSNTGAAWPRGFGSYLPRAREHAFNAY